MPTCMALAGSGINAVDSSSVTALGRAARSALRTAAAFLDRSHFPGRFALRSARWHGGVSRGFICLPTAR